MERLDNRTTTILLAIVLGMTILSFLCYLTIYIQPNIPFNPLSPNRATAIAILRTSEAPVITIPTFTPDNSYPPTWTSTPTKTPGPTKTPTNTRTPTSTKTPTPTRTPTPTDTSTPRPPTLPPPPTNTSTPFPYFVSSHSSENNCADIGLKGTISGVDGLPQAGIQLQYGEIGVAGSRFTTKTDGNGRYTALLLPGANKSLASTSHNWYISVLENGRQASEEFKFTTDPIYAQNPSYCKGIDPDEDEDEFVSKGCIFDPCRSDDSIQVKIVNWQMRRFD